MYRHVDEAMILNQSRSSVYQEVSGGKSRVVSEAMISFERALSRSASLADALALPLNLSGIPILCADLISMSKTPPLRFSYEQGAPSLSQFHLPDLQSIKAALNVALMDEDFNSLVNLSNRYIHELEHEPRFNCMVRHFLESIRRMAGLAPQYQLMAKSKLGAKTAKFISKNVINGHIKGLDEAAHIDLLAAPLQAQNLPIVCQDIPHIPPAPNLLSASTP